MLSTRLLLLVLFCAFFVAVHSEEHSLKWWTAQVRKWFRKEKVVPQIVKTPPTWFVTVDWGGSADTEANLGNVLPKQLTEEEPKDLHFMSEKGKFYTIAVIDPDAPQNIRPFRHWLVINIPGHTVSTGREAVRKGQVVSSYYEPDPPAGTGDHRYIYLVYQQLNRLGNVKEKEDLDDRYRWNVSDFARRYDLKGPHAGNFFYVKS